MIMDPMSNFTKEDWEAIERQGQHEAEMSAILSIKKDIDKKLNEMKLNQELEFNVKSVIAEYYPEEYKNHGDVLIYKTIEFIKKNCQLSIANDKDAIRTATKIAINYNDIGKMVDVENILAIYDYLDSNYREYQLKSYYERCRLIILDCPKTINYIFGTRITKKTSMEKENAILEDIINGKYKVNVPKIKNCSEEDKQGIKYVLLAIKNIKVFEQSTRPEVQRMVHKSKVSLGLEEETDEDLLEKDLWSSRRGFKGF